MTTTDAKGAPVMKTKAVALTATICSTLILLAILGALTQPRSQAATTATAAPGWHNMLPKSMRHPCKEEDSTNCYWDASNRGNGRGHSFIVREFPGRADMICVMYIKRADARRWDYCQAMKTIPAGKTTRTPEWLSCNLIHNNLIWRICYHNINAGHATWTFLGRYDNHRGVWAVFGNTTVFLNRRGWVTTS